MDNFLELEVDFNDVSEHAQTRNEKPAARHTSHSLSTEKYSVLTFTGEQSSDCESHQTEYLGKTGPMVCKTQSSSKSEVRGSRPSSATSFALDSRAGDYSMHML